MAADLNIDVRASIVGSTKGSDTNAAFVRRLAESWGTKFTFGTDTTAAESQYFAYNTVTVSASSTISLELDALAGADGKTYAFTSIKGFFVEFGDSTANNDLLIYGDFFVDTGAGSPITSASEDAQFRIQPGGMILVTAPGSPYLSTTGVYDTITLDNQASSPAGGVAVTYAFWGMGALV